MRRFYCLLFLIILSCPLLLAGEPEWIEVRSPHFSVVTDDGERRGREVAMRFEQMRAVFAALIVKANVNLPIPLQIVAFRNTKEMRQVAPLFNGKPTEVAGLFQQGSDRCFIMLDMSTENPWRVVFHEYAHQLLNGTSTGTLDPWFEEGFAEYFSSIEVDDKEARVGRIPDDEYAILRQVGTMKIADLFKVRQNSKTYNESGDHRTTFYAESGILMHYIYDNSMLPKVGTYYDLRDRHVSVEDAIQRAFGMSADGFDMALRGYIRSGRFLYYRIPNPGNISSKTYTALPLDAASANAVVADIHLHSRDYQERAITEFEEILKHDPRNAAACRGLGYAYLQKQDFPHASEYFRRASELNSNDPRVHYYSALLISRDGSFGSRENMATMARELDASISLDPNFADSYALLAYAQSMSGDRAQALTTMVKAVAISPRNKNYQFNLANLYMANRQPEKAVAILQPLQVTDNLDLATRVAQMLAAARQMSVAAQTSSPTPTAEPPQEIREGASMTTTEADRAPVDPAPADRAPVDPAPADRAPVNPAPVPAKPAHTMKAGFLRGTLVSADCSTAPSAVLTVSAGGKMWRMTVADKNHLILIGVEGFSCSWNKKKVAINYRETAEGEGSVISLEMQ